MTGPYVLRVLGFAGIPRPGQVRPAAGSLIQSYDPEAHDGQGDAQLTALPWNAMQFATFAEAMATWQAVPVRRPVRPDGKPNRPLTAFTIEVVPLADVLDGR